MDNATNVTWRAGNQIAGSSLSPLYSIISTLSAGCLGIVGNVFVVVVIFSTKQLRTPCFTLIAASAIGAFLLALGNFVYGVYQMGQYTGVFQFVHTGTACLFLTIIPVFSTPFHAASTCLVGIDRFVSLMWPMKYRTFGKAYANKMIKVAAVSVGVLLIIGVALVPFDKTLTCRNMVDLLPPTFVTAFSDISNAFLGVNVSLYVIILVVFYRKLRSLSKGTQNYKIFMKQQAAAVPAVRLMALLYFVFIVVPSLAQNVCTTYFDRTNFSVAVVLLISNGTKVAGCLIDFFSLLISCEGFRQGAAAMFGTKATTTMVQSLA